MSESELDVSTGIVVFSSDYCPYCIRAKQLLQGKKVDFKEIKVDGNAQIRNEMTAMAGKRSVPQIWIHGQHIGGCDDLVALDQRGELDALIV